MKPKENTKKFKTPMELEDFVYLMLSHLASSTKIHMLLSPNLKTASIPLEYKQIIEEILYSDNNWKYEFSTFIDMNKYFTNQLSWEKDFASTLEKVLKKLNKTSEINLITDTINIVFTPEEIESIQQKYDEKTNLAMNHFVNLLGNNVFTRDFQISKRNLMSQFPNKTKKRKRTMFSKFY